MGLKLPSERISKTLGAGNHVRVFYNVASPTGKYRAEINPSALDENPTESLSLEIAEPVRTAFVPDAHIKRAKLQDDCIIFKLRFGIDIRILSLLGCPGWFVF